MRYLAAAISLAIIVGCARTAPAAALITMPHMVMTAPPPPTAADSARAAQILERLRPTLARFRDYRTALADGFHIFLPNVPQRVYHFTNHRWAIESRFRFDPARPPSLLYAKTPGGFRLVGAMFTAPPSASLADLDARVPRSIGTWHEHVNWCLPPRGESVRSRARSDGQPLFGPNGAISTRTACSAAGGRFVPRLFGWMIHVHPDAADPSKIWGTHHGEEGHGMGMMSPMTPR